MFDFIKVRLIGCTQPLIEEIPDTKGIISYCARVSNPDNQTNFQTQDKLLAYCFREGHVSVFETVNLVFEIEVPRDISRQILRHRSMNFQEYSLRYAKTQDFCLRETRLQDMKNRQNSVDVDVQDLEQQELNHMWQEKQRELLKASEGVYQWALSNGIAKEQARAILPEGLTMSKLYANATVRSWIHYTQVRAHESTQKEHRDVALKVIQEIQDKLPSLAGFFK